VLEDPFLIRLGYSYSVVFDRDPGLYIVSADDDVNRLAGAEFYCVLQ
jgi:hypothetical protein